MCVCIQIENNWVGVTRQSVTGDSEAVVLSGLLYKLVSAASSSCVSCRVM